MKIEMGESLFYSWLRHVKECQVVQTNWKVSPQWASRQTEVAEKLMAVTDDFFSKKYGYRIYKKNVSLSQLIQQGECDAIGISIQENGTQKFYGVDVAFHESGLNYGTREETVCKIIAKSLRTAICLYTYMGAKDAEVIFASPKINLSILQDALPCIDDCNMILAQEGFGTIVRVIANEEFNSQVLQPILLVSNGVTDTSELFLRSYQMLQMFDSGSSQACSVHNSDPASQRKIRAELKVGQLANTYLRELLVAGVATEDEVRQMNTLDYSRRTFGIGYPLLVREADDFDRKRYYAEPLSS